jgi:hypothetical protein
VPGLLESHPLPYRGHRPEAFLLPRIAKIGLPQIADIQKDRKHRDKMRGPIAGQVEKKSLLGCRLLCDFVRSTTFPAPK